MKPEELLLEYPTETENTEIVLEPMESLEPKDVISPKKLKDDLEDTAETLRNSIKNSESILADITLRMVDHETYPDENQIELATRYKIFSDAMNRDIKSLQEIKKDASITLKNTSGSSETKKPKEGTVIQQNIGTINISTKDLIQTLEAELLLETKGE